MQNVVSYTPVPIVTLAESLSNVSQVCNLSMSNVPLTFGFSSMNDSFQPLFISMDDPAFSRQSCFCVSVTPLQVAESAIKIIDSPERKAMRKPLSLHSALYHLASSGLYHIGFFASTANFTKLSTSFGVRFAIK